MSTNRRRFFAHMAASGAGVLASGKSIASEGDQPAGSNDAGKAPEREPATNVERDPFRTPDLPKLPWKMIDGVKEFHLVAEVVRTEFMPGRVVDAWGYNGSVPGPSIEVDQGDRVRIVFENRLPELHR